MADPGRGGVVSVWLISGTSSTSRSEQSVTIPSGYAFDQRYARPSPAGVPASRGPRPACHPRRRPDLEPRVTTALRSTPGVPKGSSSPANCKRAIYLRIYPKHSGESWKKAFLSESTIRFRWLFVPVSSSFQRRFPTTSLNGWTCVTSAFRGQPSVQTLRRLHQVSSSRRVTAKDRCDLRACFPERLLLDYEPRNNRTP